ncbi:MAG TPA: neuraminidase-like domain-containing protein [Pyrinomonadaceae bacterium]|nr:neuraminidase-like domain-containing protein [Pyrinomonadaceae bacterium]
MAKQNKTFKILGRVVDLETQTALAGLRVEAWDKDLIQDDLVGSCVTNEEGVFEIEFAENYFAELFFEHRPDLFFRVFRNSLLLRSTEDSILWNVEVNTEIVIEVDTRQTKNFEVNGAVRLGDGSPARGFVVAAFDRSLREEQRLGTARTTKDGNYAIKYSPSQCHAPGSIGPNLIIKVLASDGSVLATSSVLFNAPSPAQLDVTIPLDAFEPPSLYERIALALQPLLSGLKVEELREDQDRRDLTFLSGETGFGTAPLARFVIAVRLRRPDLPPEFWFALTGSPVFEYRSDLDLNDQLGSFLDRLPALDGPAVRKTLLGSVSQKEIGNAFREQIPSWIEAFLKFAAQRMVGAEASPTIVKLALEDAGIASAEKQQTFARLFNEHGALTPDLLAALKKDKSFKQEEIDDLRTSFALNDLTQADFSVVKAIKQEFGVRQPDQIRTLAKKSGADWIQLIRTRHAAGEIKLPVESANGAEIGKPPTADVYGSMLERQFREAFPTTAFAGGLERALNNGGARGVRHATRLAAFLDRHQDFDFLKTPVDKFLKNTASSDSNQTSDNDFKTELKGVQRVFKLAPSFGATDALLADGVHSAQQVYRMGKTAFVRRYEKAEGFTVETAAIAWNRAFDTHAAVLTIVADLKALDGNSLPQVLLNNNSALESFPNWNNLFQAGDLCECEACRSVLGPAAYFADLLVFLKDRKAANPAQTVKDILFDRRPDLGYLELNCDNALVTLPYVDVVCEVLENVIAAGAGDVELMGLTNIADDSPASMATVLNALTAQGLALGSFSSLRQVALLDPDRWVVHGDQITYLLKKKATANFFAEILRNTKTTADELRAYPQYVNSAAYAKMRAARFPFALPFDLFAEEVRSAMQKTNLQRWDLMGTFRGNAAPNNPTDGDIASEYFKISADASASFDEKRLIMVADTTTAGQQTIWGEAGNAAWLTAVSNVKTFLLKTALEYNDLLALLDLKFINPAGDIVIHHQDASCDTDKKDLQVLDEATLDRIHRFLRLWRKLDGWKMWELDLVIRHPALGAGSLDENFLINLMHFAELKKRLGPQSSVEQIGSLFGDLNTETRFTKLHKKRNNALYQNLFLNRRLINPLDPAFEIDPATNDLAGGQIITDHRPVVLSALGIREADLAVFQGLTKTSDGTAYINDDLTLANLSFLSRHAWLSKLLKLKADDWRILLKLIAEQVPAFPNLAAQQAFLEQRYNIKAAALSQLQVDALLLQVFHQNVFAFASPKSARDLIEKLDRLKERGFAADELNWLLAADRTAKAALKETDAARFLAGLRKELQQIKVTYDSAQYDFLNASPPTDSAQLSALLTSLLQQLDRSESEVQPFLLTLLGAVDLTTSVQGLPAAFVFPGSITGAPNNIPISYDKPNGAFHFHGTMTDAQHTTLLTDASLAAVSGDSAYQNAVEELFQLSLAAPSNFAYLEIDAAIPGGIILPTTQPSLPISYNPLTQKLSFTGLMSDAERAALNLAGNPAAAIDELFQLPRLAVKFFQPIFSTPLETLPEVVSFQAQLPPELAAKVTYDADERVLRFTGIMKQSEQAALDALVPNVLPVEIAYHNAVSNLLTQPQTIVAPDERVWLTNNDLDASLPASDTLAKRLASAIQKALAYLTSTLSDNEVVQASSAQLGLSEALTRRLFTQYAILPLPPNTPLLTYFTQVFAPTIGVVDYASAKAAFDGWFWASRVAALWKKWKLTAEEWERLNVITPGAEILDFLSLPLDSSEAAAPIGPFIRMNQLFRLRDTLPETGITLFEVLEKLAKGAYATTADFAADVELVNDEWLATDVLTLIPALDLAFPADYLLAENWERLRRAFYFVASLNAGPGTVQSFAAATMGPVEAKELKELLRSKFGTETWLTISVEIQDVLRERKRDALGAYLLTQPQPADAPSGKWENTNDLYAYYLLDVEMCSCLLTSRLVQASGSVQLFVQRCLMGIEPQVEVIADGDHGDSAWHWWEWMSKYRIWEANRKVFLWPENWIEPELRKDKSQFFQALEDELLQNDITQESSETAIENYLQLLDGVAQLEVAGFYHEDDGDNAIVHVFGRTRGAEPHLYYYRRYDYRQWTPWEKVELDIEGDYLVPVVLNGRLFLFWPIFKEVPDQSGDGMVKVPKVSMSTETSFKVAKAQKRLRLQMAVSDYRSGKWSAKRISKSAYESNPFDVELIRKHYLFYPIDRSEIDGRFGIKFEGASAGSDGFNAAGLFGVFEVAGCTGAPELVNDLFGNFIPAVRPEVASTGNLTVFQKWSELGPSPDWAEPGPYPVRADAPDNDFRLQIFGSNQGTPGTFAFKPGIPILMQTPWFFKMTPPWHLSYFDKLILSGLSLIQSEFGQRLPTPAGSWLPFFYNDKQRSFFVLPSLLGAIDPDTQLPGPRLYYPEMKKAIRNLEDFFEGQIRTWAHAVVPALPAADKTIWGNFFQPVLNLDVFPPYTDEQLEDYATRYFMRFYQWYLGLVSLFWFQFRQFHFKNFYHPFVCDFAKLVYNPLQGIPAMMSRTTQLLDSGFRFKQSYQPTVWVVEPPTEDFYPREVVDFTPDGAYSPYNWELFFHVPLLIANSLSRNQKFEEARDWYHFIFNPVGVAGPTAGGAAMSRYWITKPFFETTDPQYIQQRIENIMRMLAGDTSVPGFSPDAKKALEDQVYDWRTYPFEPHRIANYRTVAYQKTTVMKYLDNLVAWGDYLFQQDSMESINEATQLYILAAEILGPRPKKVPPQVIPPLETFNELENDFDKFSNALVEVENVIPPMPGSDPGPDPAPLPMLYFCIPQNEKLLGYWDTVADRLYKIRHCMNIEGVVRQLSLFEPPIDPAALVKAVAGGMDISSALADLNAPLPLYRFSVLLQRAKEVCADVRSLGSALLAALEKKDAEALALLRQTHEIDLLKAVKTVREKQIAEAKENLESLKRSKETAEVKRDYYREIEKISAGEQQSLDKFATAQEHSGTAQSINIGASMLGYIPNVMIGGSGFGGSPEVNAQWGTGNIISALQAAAGSENQLAGVASFEGNRASTTASHERRFSDWKLQESLADHEIVQLEKQIDAAEVRIAIAEQELENQNLQIENSKSIDEFMRSKYTNKDLYQWQIGQISSVYFQSYKLAYDLAKRAERCFRFELGLQDSSYINFGYWDSLKKGLLSGEKLQYDLHRLENAHLEQNRREFELTKHVSLALLDPLALLKLRETGKCFFRLPEELLDLDFPGHYFRRIKSVSLSLPCVVGPYTTISCTLRLLKNSIRINTSNGDNGYPRNTDDRSLPADDTRFVQNNIAVKAIAASSAQNDSGTFELAFRDDRYLPFEGAGAISEWSLELFSDPSAPDFGKPLRQFDYATISDAVVHIKYTAREDAGPFKNGAIKNLRDYYSADGTMPLLRLFNLRQEFPAQWHRFLNPTNPANGNVFELEMSPSRFSLKDSAQTLKINTVWLLARCTDPGTYGVVLDPPLQSPSDVLKLAPVNQYGGLHFSQKDVSGLTIKVGPTVPPLTWVLRMRRQDNGNLQLDTVTNEMEVSDLWLVVGCEWEP